MFCPRCKAEYRDGFTECSDCGVPLVRTLADASASGGAPDSRESVELLWSGIESAASTAIAEALDAAKISFHATSREVGPLPGLSRPVYAILIHSRDRIAARAALEVVRQKLETSGPDAADAADLESTSNDPAQNEDSGDSSALPPPDYVPEDFDPDDATAEVWSGTDAMMAQSLKNCLRENGIGCVVSDVNGNLRVCVLPSAETRAREIVREIVEATPPS